MRKVVLAVILWIVLAFVSTTRDDRECYIVAEWNGRTWEYGEWKCLE